MGWKKVLWPEWEICGSLGSGAFGNVYKIRRQDLGGTYFAALKVITVPQSRQQEKALAEQMMSKEQIDEFFRRMVVDISKEIAVMEHMKGHTNIVSYEDHKIVPHEKDPGYDILIRMELLKSLPEHLEGKTIDEGEVCKIGMDICRALDLCEKGNIIHRDVKPGNIFYSEFGDYKLGDFSLVRSDLLETESTSPKGTYSYMAPEVFHGASFDHTADIYSLGLVLYRLMNCGRGPFQPLPPVSLTPMVSEEANRRRFRAARLPKPKDASLELSEVILKATAGNPQDRFQNARDLLYALAECRRGEGMGKNLLSQQSSRGFGQTVLMHSEEDRTMVFTEAGRGHPQKEMSDFFMAAGDL